MIANPHVLTSGPAMRRRWIGRFRAFGVAAGLCALASSGCGGAQFDGQTYRNEQLAFRVGPVPEGWRTIEASEALLAFRDDHAGATIAVNGRCGQDSDDVPLVALTNHLFLQFTERELVDQKAVSMDGREALRTEMLAALDGVPKRYTVYVLKKDGCVYDFLHIADTAAAASSAEFERFVRGFATLSPS
jgi:hypothetical protein